MWHGEFRSLRDVKRLGYVPSGLKLGCESLQSLVDGGNGFLHRAIESSACGIQMSAAVEELLCHLIGGEVVNRSETDPDEVVFLGILTQRDGEFQSLDLLGDV